VTYFDAKNASSVSMKRHLKDTCKASAHSSGAGIAHEAHDASFVIVVHQIIEKDAMIHALYS